jgi:hypothetical protein
MHLYEEYKEYENLWEEAFDEPAATLTEGIIVQTLAEILATVSFIVGTIGAVGVFFSTGSLFVTLVIVVISLIVKVLAELISEFTLPVFPLTGRLFEDVTDATADLEQLIANVDILQKAQTNPKIQKQVQTLYDLLGSEKAQKIVNKTEAWLHKHSKKLAELLTSVTAKDLEANEKILIQQALNHIQKESTTDNVDKG